MKKLALGCGLALVVTGVAAAAVAYYLYRQVSSSVIQFAELAQLPDIERSLRNRATFEPPASQELTDRQIEKLVEVQSAVRRQLGQSIAAFEDKYRALMQKDSATFADAPAVLSAYGDLARAWIGAKRAQVEALNAADLSLDEYRWIRDQAYQALGKAFVDLDIGRIVEDARRGVASATPGRLLGAVEPSGPQSNRERIQRVKKILEENLALASFGL